MRAGKGPGGGTVYLVPGPRLRHPAPPTSSFKRAGRREPGPFKRREGWIPPARPPKPKPPRARIPHLPPDATAREKQYRSIVYTHGRLVLRAAGLKTLGELARKVGGDPKVVRRVMRGAVMPSFPLGLALAVALKMDPVAFYAWVWQRQRERAWWLPWARPRRRYRTGVTPLRPVELGGKEGRQGPPPPDPAPEPKVERSGPRQKGLPTGAFDWRRYDPKEDPVYAAVVRRLSKSSK